MKTVKHREGSEEEEWGSAGGLHIQRDGSETYISI